MSEYRINVRFSLEDAAQRRTAEFMETLDREQYGSRSAFAAKAICAAVADILDGDRDARLLEAIRQIVREELAALPTLPRETLPPMAPVVELTEEQEQKQKAAALAFLEGF
jgi:hypothetical protein